MKEKSFLKDFLFAHRGFHDKELKTPENTLKAYKRALENNFAIELDVRVSKDLKFVCFHDESLLRMANVDNCVNSLNFKQLNETYLNNTKETIPSLEDALSLINGSIPLLIEIKPHKNYKETLPIFTELMDKYNGKFAVFSFDYRIVKWFKKNKPNYIRGQITSYFHENPKMPKIMKYLMKIMFFNKFTKPDFISYNILNVPNKYISKAKRKDILLLGYTVFNKDQFDESLKHLDNVVFEGFNPNK